MSQVAFPKASTVRWRHPATADRPAVDTFWYDGGMKPQTPEELYEDGEDLQSEGMLWIGDRGKILCDFYGNAPRLIPKSRQQSFAGSVAAADVDPTKPEDEWIERDSQRPEVARQLRAGGAARRSRHAGGDRVAGALQTAAVGCGGDAVHQLARGDASRAA